MSVSILIVGSEALPFSKTGGLADVLGALPLALGRLGHRVTLVTPKYRSVQAPGTTRSIHVTGIGGAITETKLLEVPLADNVKAVLVDRPELYNRDTLYGAGGDYPDSPRGSRFCAAPRSSTSCSRARRSTSCTLTTGKRSRRRFTSGPATRTSRGSER
jgi:glycogen synthase